MTKLPFSSVLLVGIGDPDVNLQSDQAQARANQHVLDKDIIFWYVHNLNFLCEQLKQFAPDRALCREVQPTRLDFNIVEGSSLLFVNTALIYDLK